MFNFTTQTIFNKINVSTLTNKGDKPAKGANVIVNNIQGVGPEVRIGNTRFNASNVIDIQVKNHTVEHLAKVEFDLATAISLATQPKPGTTQAQSQEGNYRIALYIGLSMNSQDSFYSNNYVYKGKPLFIEFPINANDTATTAADRLVKIADKYMLFTAQKKILSVSANAGVVTFEGVDGYQQIKKAVLQKYDPEAEQIDCCITSGDFVDLMYGLPVKYTTDANGNVTMGTQYLDSDGLRNLNSNEVPIEPGLEAFGDYNWIMHNLRLPTLMNTYYWAVNKGEMPQVGGNYTQIIVRMCVNRDGIAGGVVGQRATSVTTHVFYVLDEGNNVATLQSVLAPLTSTFLTDADTVLQDPYANA